VGVKAGKFFDDQSEVFNMDAKSQKKLSTDGEIRKKSAEKKGKIRIF